MINIVNWNAEGVKDKNTELQNFTIFFIQETQQQDRTPFNITGYTVLRSNCNGRKRDGVITLVRNNLNASKKELAEYIQTKINIKRL